jgi:hypothetical protein
MVEGANDRWNLRVDSQVIGTAGTKTYLGQSSWNINKSFRSKSFQVINVGFSNTGAGTAGSLIAGVIEVSNDNSHWGTLAEIDAGTLASAASYFWNGTNAWGYFRIGIAYPADNIGTASFYAVF